MNARDVIADSIGSRSLVQERDDEDASGVAMVEALQINFALWGMIICAAIKIGHLVAVF